MKNNGLFIIGTDTDVGKTFVTAHLAAACKKTDYSIGAIKPIASGCMVTNDERYYSQDALEIMRLSNIPLKNYEKVCPFSLPGNFSPKISSEKFNITIDIPYVKKFISNTIHSNDFTLIESAGGLTTPLTHSYLYSDLISELEIPVLLVSDGRLGCINRVILTAFMLNKLNIPIIGIVINDVNNTPHELLRSNCEEIELYTKIPILAILPHYKKSSILSDESTWINNYIDLTDFLLRWESIFNLSC